MSTKDFLRRNGKRTFVFSKRSLLYWYRRLNRELFDDRLELPDRFYVRFNWPYAGMYFENEITINGDHSTYIDVVTALAHEMLHQYQDQMGRPTDHGPYFQRRALRAYKLLGYTIQ